MNIQGAIKSALRERGDDLYETPACAIRALMRAETLPHVIWEPCAGRGAISRELISAGHAVIAQDLCAHPGADNGIAANIDFLMEHKAPPACQTIVTNPPFKLADQFIRHGVSLGCNVIALLRLMAIEGKNRSDLVDNHLVRVWAGIERLPMMHQDGYEHKKTESSGMPFAWFVFKANGKQSEAIELRRLSWKAA